MTTLNNTAITGTVSINLPSGQITNADISSSADIETTKMAQRVLAEYPVPVSAFRVWDAYHSLPVNTPATDDLALLTGTFGTDAWTIETGDLKAAGSTSRKIFFEMPIPPNYEDGTTIQIRVRAGMETTVADVAATVDLEAYIPAGDGSVGSDVCTTAAQSANSLTEANLDFTIDPTAVDPSDRLMCVITFLVNDGGTGTAVTGAIYNVSLLCDTRG